MRHIRDEKYKFIIIINKGFVVHHCELISSKKIQIQ